jgi:hypothetical protein
MTMKGKLNMKLQNLIHILIGIGCIGLLPGAQAISPAPDGGYPGGNTAEGQNALFGLTTGGYNTGVGFLSLRSNSTTSFNTAIGAGTLLANTADGNTATGAAALFSNTTGPSNTATGAFALFSNTTNGGNTANGYQALFYNTGFGNTADGYQALYSNTTGHENAANGGQALFSNNTGFRNTAIGQQALGANTTGHDNIAIGVSAGSEITTAHDVICIGHPGPVTGVSNGCFIGQIYGVTTVFSDVVPVLIDSEGQLGTTSSSRRFKKEIKPMDQASEAILALKPVTFQYKIDTTGTQQFGLIAEEVAEVNPHLVVRDKKGEIYTVRYDAVNAMLLNEFLKEHRKVEELGSTVTKQEANIAQQRMDFEAATAQQQKEIQALTASLTEQEAQIQKVSDQLAAASPSRGGLNVSKTHPQIVLNDQ